MACSSDCTVRMQGQTCLLPFWKHDQYSYFSQHKYTSDFRPEKVSWTENYTYQQISYVFINCVETDLTQFLLHIKALTKRRHSLYANCTNAVCSVQTVQCTEIVQWQNKGICSLSKAHNLLKASCDIHFTSYHSWHNARVCQMSPACLDMTCVPFTTWLARITFMLCWSSHQPIHINRLLSILKALVIKEFFKTS